MRIVHVVNFFLPDKMGGTEMYALNLATKQQLNGETVCLVRPDYWGREDYVFEGLQVKYYPEAKRVATKEEQVGKRGSEGIPKFVELIKQLKAEIVHFHEIAGSNGISAHHIEALKKSTTVKTVYTIHLAGNSCTTNTLFYKDKFACDGKIRLFNCTTCALHKQVKYTKASDLLSLCAIAMWKLQLPNISGYPKFIFYLRKNLGIIAKHSDRIIVLTEWYKSVLLENNLPVEKITVIKQGSALQEVPIPKPATLDSNKIIFVGRISHDKGLHILLNALADCKELDIMLDIYGKTEDVEYFHRCEDIIRKREINVHFKGMISNNSIVSVIQQYNALILPSFFSEMSPLVIQEAFAAKVPVIASAAYGNVEQITHLKNGLIFHFGSVQDLAKQLKYFYSSATIREKLISNINAINRNFAEIADETLVVYTQILQS